jgi:site-specific recombinase XerC
MSVRALRTYNLRVKDIDLKAGLIHYVACAKRKRVATVALLPREVRAEILPLMAGRTPDAWLFTCEGRKVQQSSFRKRFTKAAKQRVSARRWNLAMTRSWVACDGFGTQ